MNLFTKVLMLLILVGCFTSSVQADRKSREEEKARLERIESQKQQVESILRQETAGQVTDRKAALKELLTQGEAPDEAYWQAGYIRQGDKWVSVEDRWLTPEQERELEEYTKARYNYADSDEAQYKLAQWCDEHGFEAQAYAHLKAVLLNNPEHAGLRQMLGYQKIGNRWMNEEEYNAAVREAERLAKELQQWGPQVAEIREGLHSSDPRQQNRAKARLKEITEVAAVPALELILMPSSDLGAAACVDQLCQIDHRRSSIVLCKVAIFLPESSVSTKQSAIKELKTRPLEDFVPILLRQTSSPMSYYLDFFTNEELFLRHRTADLQVYGVKESFLTTDVYVNHNLLDARPSLRRVTPEFRGQRGFLGLGETRFANTANDASREYNNRMLMDVIKISEKRLEQVDTESVQLTNRILELLAEVTGNRSFEQPQEWWQWWSDYQDLGIGPKRAVVQNIVEFREGVLETEVLITGSSCFIAGTPVWTDRGPRPIEQLKVGDMALTKDVETGKLAYRPIIRRTVRESNEIVTIDFGTEHITSTGSHPFWISGAGWVKARNLQSGQFVHTPTGVVRVEGVTSAREAEVYNLIVDGFHTYFVGISQALCHDISMTPPTDAVVPGLLDH